MVVKKVKSAAKKLFSKGGSSVYTLEEILGLSYVKDVMKEADVKKIKRSYYFAPMEVRASLSAKLRKMEATYKAISNEKDPRKKKALILQALTEGAENLKERAKTVKKKAVKQVEAKQHAQEVAEVEAKLAKI